MLTLARGNTRIVDSEDPKESDSPDAVHRVEATGASADERVLLLQRVQPGLSGLIDGSLSSLAPIFAVVMSTQKPGYAFVAPAIWPWPWTCR
jgi:hypothetical protein